MVSGVSRSRRSGISWSLDSSVGAVDEDLPLTESAVDPLDGDAGFEDIARIFEGIGGVALQLTQKGCTGCFDAKGDRSKGTL